MSSVISPSTAARTKTPNVGMAIFALAMGGVGIGVTEFTMMGLLKEVEQGLTISTPEAGHLISAYALGVVVGAPLLAAASSAPISITSRVQKRRRPASRRIIRA
jgi:DHA1 family inner membrane transport protein